MSATGKGQNRAAMGEVAGRVHFACGTLPIGELCMAECTWLPSTRACTRARGRGPMTNSATLLQPGDTATLFPQNGAQPSILPLWSQIEAEPLGLGIAFCPVSAG